MEKKTKIILGVSLAVLGLAAVAYAFTPFLKKDSKEEKPDDDKTVEDKIKEVVAQALKKGTVKTGTTSTNAVNTAPAISGKVSDAVNKYPDADLHGKKVYALYSEMTAYDTVNKVYTKTNANQLMGTFAYSKPLATGGKNVYIKTNDPQFPYIYMRADFLKF